MTWTTHHRRGAVLRDVVAAVDARRDGRLPLDIPGVAETFDGDLDLLAMLTLRWHTRLAGRLEQTLSGEALDPAGRAVAAWRQTAADLPGVRAVLDAYTAAPTSEEMARALAVAAAKERALLRAAAGRDVTADLAAPALAA